MGKLSIVVASMVGVVAAIRVLNWVSHRVPPYEYHCYHGTWVRPKLIAGWIHTSSQTTCDDPLPFKVSEYIGQRPRPYGAYRY